MSVLCVCVNTVHVSSVCVSVISVFSVRCVSSVVCVSVLCVSVVLCVSGGIVTGGGVIEILLGPASSCRTVLNWLKRLKLLFECCRSGQVYT